MPLQAQAEGIDPLNVAVTEPVRGSDIPVRLVYVEMIDGVYAPIQAGTSKPLAILSLRRNAALPALATADEQGLKDFDVDAWNAFFFPKGTPDAIVRRLARATSNVVEIPAVAKRLQEIGLQVSAPERRTPEYVAKLVKMELETWRQPLLASGAAVQ
jgi:tripartite-type tricarboxylate transporter receptor subunit TctC